LDTTAVPHEITAQSYISQLGRRGVEVVFANAGTDFAPIIEAISRTQGADKVPRFITVPHENVAMSMAYGYYRASGKIAAVMVHVSVGTANALCGLMNAARDNVPILLAAGRTPLTEHGHPASRNRPIHWGQECFDQGGMVREFVKWDYELRAGQPVRAVVDRALDIAMSEPKGPVYLTLPREVLADPAVVGDPGLERVCGASETEPAQGAIDSVAALVARAKFPVIITSSAGRTVEGFRALSDLAGSFALPVFQADAQDINISTEHEMHLGFDPPQAVLDQADLILLIDCTVPWIPKLGGPKSGTKVVHMSADPLRARYPFIGFSYDIAVAGNVAASMRRLATALGERADAKSIAARRERVGELRAAAQKRRADAAAAAAKKVPISNAYIAACLNDLKAKDAICISELGMPVAQLDLTEPGSLMGGTQAGGLGLALGAALGAKLAAPQREVIVAVGDGSYMFGNPVPYHFMQKAEGLATLTIIANNSSWHAVRTATLHVYPDGRAAAANQMPLTELTPSPAYEKTIETIGGFGCRVEHPDELKDALAKGLEAVRSGTPALINVITQARA
jgi:acetolactate synthase-1/2/3 large subunit